MPCWTYVTTFIYPGMTCQIYVTTLTYPGMNWWIYVTTPTYPGMTASRSDLMYPLLAVDAGSGAVHTDIKVQLVIHLPQTYYH